MTFREELQNLNGDLQKYLDGKVSANQIIGKIATEFDPNLAVDLMILVRSITRHEAGELTTETFRKMWSL